jgi:phycocyanobilin lyase beta subunit
LRNFVIQLSNNFFLYMDTTNSLMPTLERIDAIATLEPVASHLEPSALLEREELVEPMLERGSDSELPIDFLIDSLADPDTAVATQAMEALVGIGDRVVPALIATLDNYVNCARLYAVKALARIGSPESLDILIRCAQPDELMLGVRRAAIVGLTRIDWQQHEPDTIANQQTRILELLKELCTDANWSVRYAVVVALAHLSQNQEQLQLIMGELLEPLYDQETEPVVKTRAIVVLQQYLT